ncbi:MAG: peptidylprolyl isomerase, partial [Flavobacteriaceae bacterium]|nr:peptidylprolyl isomerase [Flavobacteriaceae bacterium]
KISEARDKIIGGAAFIEVANEFSEDPSVKVNGGDLGYFSAFSMVYTFENAAYNTKTDEVSLPFRTQFGYHILKVVDKRQSPGEIEVAHIMVKNNVEDTAYAENKIMDIYHKLEQGDDFGQIAIEHSDDQSSAKKGGKLPRFGTGRMIKSFEEVAFNLENEGDFSKPFKTDYGWHILKLLKKYPVKSYDELHDQLEGKIKGGNRSVYVEKALASELSKNYTLKENKQILSSFYNNETAEMTSDNALLHIENEVYTAKDFYDFSLNNKNKNIEALYDDFKNKMIIDYYKNNLEYTNEAFALTYKEYQDGLLLFELLQKNIWDKAENDSVGLQQYFNANQEKYTWKKRGVLTIASCTQEEKAVLVKKYMTEGKSTDEIKDLINEGATIHVLFSKAKLEEGSSKLPQDYVLKKGVSDIYTDEPHHFTIINTSEIIPPSNKKLNETRGEVINDYQTYLEAIWVKELHETYTVKINKRNYNNLKREFNKL